MKELDGGQRATFAAPWKKVTAPPNYIAMVVDEQFINQASSQSSRQRCKGVLLTWMLPDDLVNVSAVLSKGEPTASLKEVVSHLRVSRSAVEVEGHPAARAHMHAACGWLGRSGML